MTITSAQKKFALPLTAFVVSFSLYVMTLGGWFCFLMIPVMTISGMFFCRQNWDWMAAKVSSWVNRDGWK